MPKKTFEAILEAISQFHDGVSLSSLMDYLEGSIPKRTLQRHLAELIQKKLLIVEGKTRGRKYKLPRQTIQEQNLDSQKKGAIPLSTTAQEIEQKITKPIQTRKHTSYNRKFLDRYRPNSIYYLSTLTRNRLLEMGSSNESDQPAGTYVRKILNRLLIDLSWNSSRLEGNTYSLLETEKLLICNEPSEGKDLKETQMILNHKAAIEFLVDIPGTIDRFTMLNLHALLSNNLIQDPGACGSLRSIPVGISSTTYVPLAIPQLIEECFDDVNKRVSRLGANIPLIKNNLCPLSFVDVPEKIYINGLLGVYELNQIDLMRDLFVWAYERSCSLYAATKGSLGEPDPFRLRYREQMTAIIQQIIREKMDKKKAHDSIEFQKTFIPLEDRNKFVEIVENELIRLHEGNIARYKISLKEYEKWRLLWK